jgi:hypothetical protein
VPSYPQKKYFFYPLTSYPQDLSTELSTYPQLKYAIDILAADTGGFFGLEITSKKVIHRELSTGCG